MCKKSESYCLVSTNVSSKSKGKAGLQNKITRDTGEEGRVVTCSMIFDI